MVKLILIAVEFFTQSIYFFIKLWLMECPTVILMIFSRDKLLCSWQFIRKSAQFNFILIQAFLTLLISFGVVGGKLYFLKMGMKTILRIVLGMISNKEVIYAQISSAFFITINIMRRKVELIRAFIKFCLIKVSKVFKCWNIFWIWIHISLIIIDTFCRKWQFWSKQLLII